MIDICLLGTGGMMPLPDRWLTSLWARVDGECVLIDCGEATQIALREAGLSSRNISVICITHFHGDHIAGLPGLLLLMANSGRIEPIDMIGPSGLEDVVISLLVIAPHLPFEIRFHEIDVADMDDGAIAEIPFPKFSIEAFRAAHSVDCLGYTICLDRAGKFDVDAAEALGIPRPLWSKLQAGESVSLDDGSLIDPAQVVGPARRGLRVSYVTDTRPTAGIVDAVRDADLLVLEGMYGDPSMHDKAVSKQHMMFAEAAEIARDSSARALWLTHYSPSMTHPKRFISHARDIFPDVVCAKDGQRAQLRFEG